MDILNCIHWAVRSEALKAIEVAYVEATCNANCIGLVKLMGRCGFFSVVAWFWVLGCQALRLLDHDVGVGCTARGHLPLA